MANLIETPGWEAGIYQIETTDPVEGGPAGVTNTPPRQLANRTAWLKQMIEALGTDKQPLDATLTALAALALAADKLIYATGVDAVATTTLTAFGRSLIDDADAATARATLGAASPADIATAIANLVASSPAALDTLNELATALGNDANFAATITAALGGKQPLDATLTALAGLATVADRMIYATGADAFATTPLTAFARTLMDDADAATARATLAAAPLASPALTGTPTAPTAAGGTNTTQLATTAFVQAAVTALINASPAALDTLNELAAALGNDANFAATVTASLALKAPLASPAFTGAPTVPTAAPGTNTTQAASTAFVAAAVAGVGGSVQGAFKNLQASASGTTANVSVSADEIVVESAANSYKVLRGVALVVAGTAVGANGIDVGALAINTWYSVWVIWNGATVAGLLSLSATAPTMPGGYTHKARVGWIRTDASGNKYPLAFKQSGRTVQYLVAAGSNVPNSPIMASGVAGSATATPTWVAVAIGAFVPPTVARLLGTLSPNNTSGWTLAAPNSAYGGYSSSNPAPVQAYYYTSPPFAFVPESANIHWASNVATATLTCFGWEDNL